MKRLTKNFSVGLAIIACLTLTCCVSLKSSQQALRLDKSYCNVEEAPAYSKEDLPKPFYELQLDTVLINQFSYTSLNIANAIGILKLLKLYTDLVTDHTVTLTLEKKIELIELKQQINQKISLASLEISAVSSELDCEEERANQFAYYLKEREEKLENTLIIGSIIVGSLGAISAEMISNNSSNGNLASGVIIGTSLVEATLGTLMLINKKKIAYSHPTNALTGIWTNAVVSNYFPPSVWYYLTYENPHDNEKSLAKLLVDKWFIFGQVAKEKRNSKTDSANLYFGNGGKYNAAALKNRADMLDQTESYVTLMKQDLKTLTFEIEKLQNK